VVFNASLTVFDNKKKMLSSSSLLLIQTGLVLGQQNYNFFHCGLSGNTIAMTFKKIETIDGRNFRLYWQQQEEVVEYMTCI